MDINDVPNDVLYYMCENWDTTTLVSMSEAYSKVYQLCDKIIEKRKEEYLTKKERKMKEIVVNKWFNRIKGEHAGIYIELLPNIIIEGYFDIWSHDIIEFNLANHTITEHYPVNLRESVLQYLFPDRVIVQLSSVEYIHLSNSTDDDIQLLLNELVNRNLIK